MTVEPEPSSDMQFGLDVAYTNKDLESPREADDGVDLADVDSVNDTSASFPSIPTLYPEQVCAVCETLASWAHAMSPAPPQELSAAGRSALTLWALCDRCEALSIVGDIDDLTQLHRATCELDRDSDLVRQFRAMIEEAARRTTSIHRIVR